MEFYDTRKMTGNIQQRLLWIQEQGIHLLS